MEWDTAAGQIIVEEAGGVVESVTTGKALRYNNDETRNGSFIAYAGVVAKHVANVVPSDANSIA